MRIEFYDSIINALEEAALEALDATGEQLLTDVTNAQIMPFDVGTMQNDATYVDHSHRANGQVTLLVDEPYARRLYYHPEYNFQTVTRMQRAYGLKIGQMAVNMQIRCAKIMQLFISGLEVFDVNFRGCKGLA